MCLQVLFSIQLPAKVWMFEEEVQHKGVKRNLGRKQPKNHNRRMETATCTSLLKQNMEPETRRFLSPEFLLRIASGWSNQFLVYMIR